MSRSRPTVRRRRGGHRPPATTPSGPVPGSIISEGYSPSRSATATRPRPGSHAGPGRGLAPGDRRRGRRRRSIFAQLMHGGRIGHPQPAAGRRHPGRPVSRSGRGAGLHPHRPAALRPAARLTAVGITAVIEEFAAAARNAIEAGFDGVELQAGNGSLLHQSLAANTNARPTSGAAGRRPRPGSRSRSPPRRPTRSGRTGSAADLARQSLQRRHRAGRREVYPELAAAPGLGPRLPERGRDGGIRARPNCGGLARRGHPRPEQRTGARPGLAGCAWSPTVWPTWCRSACCPGQSRLAGQAVARRHVQPAGPGDLLRRR